MSCSGLKAEPNKINDVSGPLNRRPASWNWLKDNVFMSLVETPVHLWIMCGVATASFHTWVSESSVSAQPWTVVKMLINKQRHPTGWSFDFSNMRSLILGWWLGDGWTTTTPPGESISHGMPRSQIHWHLGDHQEAVLSAGHLKSQERRLASETQMVMACSELWRCWNVVCWGFMMILMDT